MNEATAGLYVVSEKKAEFFFHTLLFCSKADFRTAFSKLNLRGNFFNEIVRVVSSTKARVNWVVFSKSVIRSSSFEAFLIFSGAESRAKFFKVESALPRSGSVL